MLLLISGTYILFREARDDAVSCVVYECDVFVENMPKEEKLCAICVGLGNCTRSVFNCLAFQSRFRQGRVRLVTTCEPLGR